MNTPTSKLPGPRAAVLVMTELERLRKECQDFKNELSVVNETLVFAKEEKNYAAVIELVKYQNTLATLLTALHNSIGGRQLRRADQGRNKKTYF